MAAVGRRKRTGWFAIGSYDPAVDWGTVLVIVAVTAFAGAVQRITGFGYALLSTPLLSAVIGPRDAVVMSVLYGMLTAITMSLQFRRTIDRPVMWRMCAGRLVGMPIGVVVLTSVSRDTLRLGIAAAVLTSTVVLWRGFRLHRAGGAIDVTAGVISGALTTSVSTGGPPLVLAMQARGMDPDTFRGTMSAVSLYTSAIAIALIAASGRFSHDAAVASVIGLPGLAAGMLAGKGFAHRVEPARFRELVLALLVLAALIAAGSVVWI